MQREIILAADAERARGPPRFLFPGLPLSKLHYLGCGSGVGMRISDAWTPSLAGPRTHPQILHSEIPSKSFDLNE